MGKMEKQLKSLMENKIITHMYYVKKNGHITQRDIQVLEIKGDVFRAYCYTRKHYRVFKISNVLALAPSKIRRGA